jgi:fatty-acyl-CoA synthase
MTATLSASYWQADTSFEVRETTVPGVLRKAAEQYGARTALVEGTAVPRQDRRRWTFEQLLADSEKVAGALLERFEPGERVACWAPNIPEWVLVELGCGLAGLVLVTVNPAYQAKELEYVLRQSKASGIILADEFRGNPMKAILERVAPGLPVLREQVRFADFAELMASSPASPRFPEVKPHDAVQIQYTSGTTGFPKGALLHHEGLTNNARAFAEIAEITPGETFISPFPLFHTAGCVLGTLGALQSGAALVPVYIADPSLILDLVETERAEVLLGVPTVLLSILESPDLAERDVSSVRVVGSGGAIVPAELVRRCEEVFGARFSVVYGTTECSPLVAQVRLDDSFADKSETLGRPVPQVEVKIVDPESGEVVPCSAVGELCVRGYNVMHGYYDLPEKTAESIDPENWYHTGDLASMDDRGYLRVEGRLKDMIIRGGENIYPREIEDLLFEHAKVAEVAVVGIPDARWGESVAAVVRLLPGETIGESELIAYCREHLAPQKTPQHWEFVDAFPLTASGKIQKFILRDRLTAAAAGQPQH